MPHILNEIEFRLSNKTVKTFQFDIVTGKGLSSSGLNNSKSAIYRCPIDSKLLKTASNQIRFIQKNRLEEEEMGNLTDEEEEEEKFNIIEEG